MHSSDKQKLLEATVAVGDYEAFREALLQSTAREFRRCHKKLNIFKWWMGLAASFVLAAVIFQAFSRREIAPGAVATQFQKSIAQPARPKIETRKHHFAVIETRPMNPLDIIRTVPDQSAIVRTRRQLPEISDHQLFALFKHQPTGFIQETDGRRFIVIKEQSDFSHSSRTQ